MGSASVLFEFTRSLWVVFLFAGFAGLWLVIYRKYKAAAWLVRGEALVALLCLAIALVSSFMPQDHGNGWDLFGAMVWSGIALLVALGTGAVLFIMYLFMRWAEAGGRR